MPAWASPAGMCSAVDGPARLDEEAVRVDGAAEHERRTARDLVAFPKLAADGAQGVAHELRNILVGDDRTGRDDRVLVRRPEIVLDVRACSHQAAVPTGAESGTVGLVSISVKQRATAPRTRCMLRLMSTRLSNPQNTRCASR